MIRGIVLLLLLLFSTPCYSARIFTEINGTLDSEDADSLEIVAGYRQTLSSLANLNFELAGGSLAYSEPGEEERFSVGKLGLSSSPDNDWQLQLHCRFLDGDSWSPVLPAAMIIGRPHRDWYIELSADRDPVDSISAIRKHIYVDSYVASVDYRINDRWTVVGAPIVQHFSDNNQRHGVIGRIINTPQKWPNFTLQLKGRFLQLSQDSPDYFSPERLSEGFLLFGYATPFADDNWVIKLLGGPGIQRIEPFNSQTAQNKPIYHGEITLRGWFNDHLQLVSRLGCTLADGAQETYNYCFGNMHLGYAW